MPRDAVAGLFSVMAGSGEQARQALAQDSLGVAADLRHTLAGRLDAVEEARGLAEHDRAAIGIARLGRGAEARAHLGPVPAQLVVAPDPLLDEPIAPDAHVGARPDVPVRDVG